MAIPYAVTVQCVWKKDQKRVETTTNPTLDGPSNNKASFNGEKLQMISTIQRSKTGAFTDKSSNIVIKISKNEKSRSVGMVNLNLAEFIDNDKGKVKMSLEKCPDKDSYIEFQIMSKLIN